MQKRFVQLCSHQKIKCKEVDKWWSEIDQKLHEKHRFYHNITHIEKLFENFDQFKDLGKQDYIIELCIFFHDIIYNCKHGEDEENSERLFIEFSKDTELEKSDIQKVSEIILATKNHLSCTSTDQDVLFFLDLDLLILGSDWEEYITYTKNVRKEYSMFDDEKFKLGRSQFLEKMLKFEKIYFTKKLYDFYQQKAMENIRKELDLLQSQ